MIKNNENGLKWWKIVMIWNNSSAMKGYNEPYVSPQGFLSKELLHMAKEEKKFLVSTQIKPMLMNLNIVID